MFTLCHNLCSLMFHPIVFLCVYGSRYCWKLMRNSAHRVNGARQDAHFAVHGGAAISLQIGGGRWHTTTCKTLRPHAPCSRGYRPPPTRGLLMVSLWLLRHLLVCSEFQPCSAPQSAAISLSLCMSTALQWCVLAHTAAGVFCMRAALPVARCALWSMHRRQCSPTADPFESSRYCSVRRVVEYIHVSCRILCWPCCQAHSDHYATASSLSGTWAEDM
jgi:hypothetical protein